VNRDILKKNEILITKLQEGNEKAWRELVNNYSDKLFGYALSLSFDHSVASDIVQQVFINFYEYRFKLKAQYSIESFLYKSVYNKFITDFRKKKSLTRLHEQYYSILEQQLNNNSSPDFSKHIDKMNLLIEKLPEKTKIIFSLKKKHGLTNKEIADYNKISLKTVESHITKAFKLLRTKLEYFKE
jgi:RNA polymerase sigma-70 factor (family 1)|tara:strand:- start:513 stop:1067 length:555 start_codon:yes stop_codon:yes gene_type:complete